jgi:hypothetical protein
MTLNLTQRAAAALARAESRSGDSKTDCINRAIQAYDLLDEAMDAGGEVTIRRTPDGPAEVLRFI